MSFSRLDYAAVDRFSFLFALKVVPHDGNVIELQLSQKGFSALPGQVC